MKKIRFAAVVCCAVALVCVLTITGCSFASKQEQKYAVSFDGNGAVAGATASVKGTEKAKLPESGFNAPEGKIFAWWNTEADGSGTACQSGESFTLSGADITLYAVWVTSYTAANYTKMTDFLVEAPSQLVQIAALSNDANLPRTFSGKTIKLVFDIDLAYIPSFTGISIDAGGRVFEGTFSGEGKKIKNMGINLPETSSVGLVGNVGINGKIIGVSIEGGSVTARDYAGGIAGVNAGAIEQSYATASLSASGMAGGIAALNSGTIKTSYAAGSVVSTKGSAGGLVGSNSGTVENSYSTGIVSGTEKTGGVAASNFGEIKTCYTIAAITAKAGSAGGIAGYNSDEKGTGGGVITACFFLKVTGGINTDLFEVGPSRNGTVTNCMSKNIPGFVLTDFEKPPFSWNTTIWEQKIELSPINGVTERPVLSNVGEGEVI